jgi:endoribonuclease LACTB2
MLQIDGFGPVTRITLGRRFAGVTLPTVSPYLVDGLLVDSGRPSAAGELCTWLRAQKLRQVFNTHHHEDHVGGNALIQRELGVPIAAATAAARLIADLPPIPFYRRVVWGRAESARVAINDGPVMTPRYCFEVIPSPGHSPDHVCLFERREGWLFAGDLFVHERVRYLRVGEDLRLEIAALKATLALEPRVMFCSHAGILTDPKAAIVRKLGFWAAIRRDAMRLRAGGASVRAIVRTTLGREDLLTLMSRGDFSKAALVCALLELPDGVLAGGDESPEGQHSSQ